VTKALVIHNANKDIDLHLTTKDARVHSFITIVVVTIAQQFGAKVVNNVIIFIFLPSFSILEFSLK
jgi:hypothetical protein